MTHGFVCWTPLHIINILNIQHHFLNDKQIVIFMYDDFSHHAELTQAIKDRYPHFDVRTIKQAEYGNKVTKISRLFLNNNPYYNEKMDALYLPGDTYFARILYANQKIHNSNLKVNYYEDGMGAYMGAEIVRHMNKLDGLQEKLNRHSLFHADWDSAYVYEPGLLKHSLAAQTVKIPKLTESNPVLSEIRDVFAAAYKINSSVIKKPTILFFDQPFLADGTQIDEVAIYNMLKVIADENDLTLQVKLHPRSPKEKYGPNVQLLETDLPWEIYILFTPIDQMILTGVNTTAAFSPYLLYGRKTLIILLSHYVAATVGNQVDSKTKVIIDNSVNLANRMKPIFGDLLLSPDTKEILAINLYQIKLTMKEF